MQKLPFKSWYKKASAIEKKESIYKEILTTFFDIFDYENSVVIAVGRNAEKSCKDFGCDCSGTYPVTDWLSDNGFYLPSASSLTEEQIKYICNVIKEFKK